MKVDRPKVEATHLARRAVVYVRQAVMGQLLDQQPVPESLTRQYALSRWALELGWTPDAVEVMDQDLGRPGSSRLRPGFEHLAEQVCRGRVGAIFVLDSSRLTRSSVDWLHLLDLCASTDVLIVDERGVFSPSVPDDLLLLKLKAQFSEPCARRSARRAGRRGNDAGRGARARGEMTERRAQGDVGDSREPGPATAVSGHEQETCGRPTGRQT